MTFAMPPGRYWLTRVAYPPIVTLTREGTMASVDNPAQMPTESVRRQRKARSQVLIALGVLVLVLGLVAYAAIRLRSQPASVVSIRPTGIPANISTPLADLMALSPAPHRPAPDFSLMDQSGSTISLSSFRGRAVVLEFTDSHCTDVCPIVSQELVDAYHQLGPAARHVVFVSVNVNPFHATLADVVAYTQEHQLNTIPSWHYFTGPVNELQVVWQAYGIEVSAASPTADVVHSDTMYFIDPLGNERYIATPMVDHNAKGTAYLPGGQLSSWGQGISLVTRQLVG